MAGDTNPFNIHAFGDEKIHESDHVFRDHFRIDHCGNRVLVVGQTAPVNRTNIAVLLIRPNRGRVVHPSVFFLQFAIR